MKTYKDVSTTRVEAQLIEHSCELCQCNIREKTRSSYDVQEVELVSRRGSSYPDGNFIKRLETDICVDCYNSVLVPFLESKGVRFRIIDEGWDWDKFELKEPGVPFEG